MAYGIGQARKLGKQNRKIIYNTSHTSSEPSIPSYSYDKLNENTNITSKKSFNAATHSRTIFDLCNEPANII